MRRAFSIRQKRVLREAESQAAELVTRFYAIAPREWDAMSYEVRSLGELDPEEILDSALAQVRLYGLERRVEDRIVDARDFFRICVQDHTILRRSVEDLVPLRALLLFVLTHELVHVVRFGQRMQTIDLPPNLRAFEEANVDRTAHLILRDADDHGMSRVLERFATRAH